MKFTPHAPGAAYHATAMFGFGDIGVTVAFLVTLGATALCVLYGITHWNDSDEAPPS